MDSHLPLDHGPNIKYILNNIHRQTEIDALFEIDNELDRTLIIKLLPITRRKHGKGAF